MSSQEKYPCNNTELWLLLVSASIQILQWGEKEPNKRTQQLIEKGHTRSDSHRGKMLRTRCCSHNRPRWWISLLDIMSESEEPQRNQMFIKGYLLSCVRHFWTNLSAPYCINGRLINTFCFTHRVMLLSRKNSSDKSCRERLLKQVCCSEVNTYRIDRRVWVDLQHVNIICGVLEESVIGI